MWAFNKNSSLLQIKLSDQLLDFPWIIIFILPCLPYFASQYNNKTATKNLKRVPSPTNTELRCPLYEYAYPFSFSYSKKQGDFWQIPLVCLINIGFWDPISHLQNVPKCYRTKIKNKHFVDKQTYICLVQLWDGILGKTCACMCIPLPTPPPTLVNITLFSVFESLFPFVYRFICIAF